MEQQRPTPASAPSQRETPVVPPGIGARFKALLWACIGGKKEEAAPGTPAWSMTMVSTNTIHGEKPVVTLKRAPGTREFRMYCEPARVFITDKLLLAENLEEADRIQAALSVLPAHEQAKLIEALTYTHMDDSRIDHPDGSGYYMQEALQKLGAAEDQSS